MLRQNTTCGTESKSFSSSCSGSWNSCSLREKKSLARLDGRHNYGYRDLCSKKIQAISLNFTWLACALNRYIYRRFIDPLL